MNSLPAALVAYHRGGGKLEGDLGDAKPGSVRSSGRFDTIEERNRAVPRGAAGSGLRWNRIRRWWRDDRTISRRRASSSCRLSAWSRARPWFRSGVSGMSSNQDSKQAAPNPRVQRTRPCASLRGSPLTRHPLGGPKGAVMAGLRVAAIMLAFSSVAVSESSLTTLAFRSLPRRLTLRQASFRRSAPSFQTGARNPSCWFYREMEVEKDAELQSFLGTSE